MKRPITGQNLTRPPCPHCGRVLDGRAGVDGTPPDDGDLSICLYCETIMAFTVTPLGVTLRAATEQEQQEMREHPNYPLILAAVRRTNAQRFHD